MSTPKCKCGLDKEPFTKRNGDTGYVCRPCKKAKDIAYRARNIDVLKARAKEKRIRDKPKMQEYRLKNKEDIAKRYREYCQENKHKIAKYRKAYQEANKHWILDWKKSYREENKDKISAYHSEYCKKNLDKLEAYNANRRSKLISGYVPFANEFFISEIYSLRKLRQQMLGIKLAVDHIVPLVSDLVCGLHHENNLQILTKDQNSSKGNRWWPDMPEYTQQDIHELQYYSWLAENAS